MSEETNEVQQGGASMDSAEFETKLTKLFSEHKESKLKLVPRIVEEFKGKENIVLEHLHNKYVLGIVAEKPKKKHAEKTEAGNDKNKSAPPSATEGKPKSKKKLILIIIISIVVIGLGVAGFLMKDKFMGKKEEPAKTETAPAENKPVTEDVKNEAAPAQTNATDSLKPAAGESPAGSADTAKVD